MRNLVILFFLVFASTVYGFGQANAKQATFDPQSYKTLIDTSKFDTTDVYVIDQKKGFRIGPFSPALVQKSDFECQVTTENGWQSSVPTTSNFILVSDQTGTYLAFNGALIPSGSYLLVRVKDAVGGSAAYVVQTKRSTDISDIQRNVLGKQISLGAAYGFKMVGFSDSKDEISSLSPVVYYQIQWVNEGVEWWKHFVPTSVGVIYTPIFDKTSAVNSDALSLLTAGVGIGLIDNILIVGASWNQPTESLLWVFALNLAR